MTEVLSQMKDLGYQILGVRNFVSTDKPRISTRSLVLRHDVDADMRAAARLAIWEQTLGVCSTYLVMLQSPLYNLFSRDSCQTIDAILSAGHELGLHFDVAFNESRSQDLTDIIDSQAQAISDFFSVPVTTFSAHQPTARALDPESYTGSLVSCYTHPIMKRLAYFSDSNREREIEQVVDLAKTQLTEPIECAPGIQLLIHPMWWVYGNREPADVWDRVLLSNLAGAQEQLALTERAFGLPRQVKLTRLHDEGATSP